MAKTLRPALALACLALVLLSGCAQLQSTFNSWTGGEDADPALAAQSHWDQAMAHRGRGELAATAQELTKAIQADPMMYQAYYQLGLTYVALNRPQDARLVWEQGIDRARSGPERQDYDRAKALAEMQAALAGLDDKPGAKSRAGRAAPARSGGGSYAVLFSSNLNPKWAARDRDRLIKLGYAAEVRPMRAKGKLWHRVWVGCCVSQSQAKALAAELKKKGLSRDALAMRAR